MEDGSILIQRNARRAGGAKLKYEASKTTVVILEVSV